MIIYKTTNLINGKVYVGKDVRNNPNYLGSGLLLRKAIQKYGKANFFKEVLQVCSSMSEMNLMEDYWIELFNSRNRNIGYNIAKGGQGGYLDHLPSDFIDRCRQGKAKMSTEDKAKAIEKFRETIAKKTEKQKQETFLKRSAAKTGQIPWNKGTKGLQKAWNKGVKLTGEQKKNMVGKPKSAEHRKNLSRSKIGKIAHNRRKIVQMDKSGSVVKTWDSVSQAAQALNVSGSNIAVVAGKENRSLAGFKWNYL